MTYMSTPVTPDSAPVARTIPPVHDARALTEDGSIAYLTLDGQTYTLRITRSDKLILTK